MRPSSRTIRKTTEKTALVLVWIPLIAFIFYITIPLGNTHATQFDTILVLGCPANPDGTPSPEQRQRVLEAVRQYRAGVAPIMILSGGAAHNRFVEADVMAQLAESSGVPSRAIVEERRAHDTIQNVEYSVQIMHQREWHTIEAITSAYHERRASLILMHSPIVVNWRMQAAPWPPSYGIADKTARYVHEIYYCAKMRIVGFQEAIPPPAQ
ncbi:MAG: YdcF family protein [Acidobacteriaceae bacterium]